MENWVTKGEMPFSEPHAMLGVRAEGGNYTGLPFFLKHLSGFGEPFKNPAVWVPSTRFWGDKSRVGPTRPQMILSMAGFGNHWTEWLVMVSHISVVLPHLLVLVFILVSPYSPFILQSPAAMSLTVLWWPQLGGTLRKTTLFLMKKKKLKQC